MKKEIWKDIKGYEGKYQVSNLGKVKSLNFKKGNQEKKLKMVTEQNQLLLIEIEKKQKEIDRLIIKCENLKENVRKQYEVNIGITTAVNELEIKISEKKKENANLKRLCTKNGIDYKTKGNK